MSDWTHGICDDCWDDKNPERPSPRSGTGEIEHCCYCGRHTVSGIYLRDDPASIEDHDDHKRGDGSRRSSSRSCLRSGSVSAHASR